MKIIILQFHLNIPEVFGCTDPWASNYNPNANSDDDGNEPCYYVCGDTDGDGIVDDESYQYFDITRGGGSWQAEVGWTIQTTDGFEYLSGGAPFDSDFSEFGICLAPGCYEVIMTDNWGDGWNGNTLEIGDDLNLLFLLEPMQLLFLKLVKADVVISLDVPIRQPLIIMKMPLKIMVLANMTVQHLQTTMEYLMNHLKLT